MCGNDIYHTLSHQLGRKNIQYIEWAGSGLEVLLDRPSNGGDLNQPMCDSISFGMVPDGGNGLRLDRYLHDRPIGDPIELRGAEVLNAALNLILRHAKQ